MIILLNYIVNPVFGKCFTFYHFGYVVCILGFQLHIVLCITEHINFTKKYLLKYVINLCYWFSFVLAVALFRCAMLRTNVDTLHAMVFGVQCLVISMPYAIYPNFVIDFIV